MYWLVDDASLEHLSRVHPARGRSYIVLTEQQYSLSFSVYVCVCNVFFREVKFHHNTFSIYTERAHRSNVIVLVDA